MLRIYLPSSTDLKLCSDVPTVDSINKWTFVTIFTSRYLGSNIWVLTIVGWKCEDESAKMKVRGWKCEDESVRMKVWGWKCEDESATMKIGGWKCKDESEGMKSARMKVRGWKCEDESVRMKVQGWKCWGWKIRGWKSQRMKNQGWKWKDENPRMKCHAAGSSTTHITALTRERELLSECQKCSKEYCI